MRACQRDGIGDWHLSHTVVTRLHHCRESYCVQGAFCHDSNKLLLRPAPFAHLPPAVHRAHRNFTWHASGGLIFNPAMSLQADLVKDGGHLYFLRYLEAADAGPPDSRAQAAFVLAVLCRPGGRGQVLSA